MKKIVFKSEEFFEFKLNPEAMNKLRGGDGIIPPNDPPGEPTAK